MNFKNNAAFKSLIENAKVESRKRATKRASAELLDTEAKMIEELAREMVQNKITMSVIKDIFKDAQAKNVLVQTFPGINPDRKIGKFLEFLAPEFARMKKLVQTEQVNESDTNKSEEKPKPKSNHAVVAGIEIES